MRRSVTLVVMDGVGLIPDNYGNAFNNANTPNLDKLIKNYPNITIKASGTAVGLPSDEDMGNSEVGHNAIGCGQIYSQGSKLVSEAIDSKEIFNSETWHELIEYSKNNTLHFIGLLSDGGVHSKIEHLFKMIKEAKKEGIKKVRVHVLLDGRDVEKTSALKYVDELENLFNELNDDSFEGLIASGGGRMKITMDRYEANWKMVENGWKTHVLGIGNKFKSATDAINENRERVENIIDQDLDPFVIINDNNEPVGTINDHDSVILFNYRGDRALEICKCFDDDNFNKFDLIKKPKVFFAGIMQYDADLKIPKHYLTNPPKITNTLTEELIKNDINEYAISETQKYGHVTYFWNGNKNEKFSKDLETWEEIPSDNISFDLKPRMKADEITEKLVNAIESNKYEFLRVNYPNGDMVGHTGNYEAAIKGVEAVDEAIGKIMNAVDKVNGSLIIIADHGNCEEMYMKPIEKYPNMVPKTSHTTNVVPFIMYGNINDYTIKKGTFGLSNIASTVTTLLDINPNKAWNESIIEKK